VAGGLAGIVARYLVRAGVLIVPLAGCVISCTKLGSRVKREHFRAPQA
jgi:hypothetical protein